MKLKGLGRGLDALLDSEERQGAAKEAQASVALEKIQPGRYQPRTRMDEGSLAELAASIRQQGLMQPILVRPVGRDRYEIIAGERRWRAAKMAGLAELPVIVREVPDSTALVMALIENIQRENLNALEEAQGVQRLISEFKLSHQDAADAIGRSRAATTNLLRLLNLAKPVQQLLFDGKLDMGHARALLAIEGRRQEDLARRVAARGLSVRETEALVNRLLHPLTAGRKRKPVTDRDVARLQEELSDSLGTTVEIRAGKKGAGRLVLHFMSAEHLDELIAKLKR